MGLFDAIFKKSPKPEGKYTGAFKMLNGYDFADLTGFDDVSNHCRILRISQNVADCEQDSGFFDGFDDIPA